MEDRRNSKGTGKDKKKMLNLCELKYLIYTIGIRKICYVIDDYLRIAHVDALDSEMTRVYTDIKLCRITRPFKRGSELMFFQFFKIKGYVFPINISISYIDNIFRERQQLVSVFNNGKFHKEYLPDWNADVEFEPFTI